MKLNRVILLSLLIFLMFGLSACEVVEDGQVGISKSFGKIGDEGLAPGIYMNVPLAREIEVWNVKTQTRRLALEIPSTEGLSVRLEPVVLFMPKKVVQLRKTVGVDYIAKVIDPALVDTIREVIGKRKVEALIKSQEQLTSEVFTQLKKKLETRGITIEEFMITGLTLPPKFKDAIENKLESEQKALQKQFELQQAKKDAEIEVARAEGAAKAQKIVRSTLSEEYLQYLWISTLNENPNVIYVSTEANMPMFRSAPRTSPMGAPK